jgi:hypothetical protein
MARLFRRGFAIISKMKTYEEIKSILEANKEDLARSKIFGAEVTKNIIVQSGQRKKWDEGMLLEDVRSNFRDGEYEAFLKIYEFAKKKADKINFGTGAYGTFSAIFQNVSSKSLLTLGADRRLSFDFEWVGKDSPENAERFKSGLDAIGFKLPKNYKNLRPGVLPEQWVPRADAFISTIENLIKNE